MKKFFNKSKTISILAGKSVQKDYVRSIMIKKKIEQFLGIKRELLFRARNYRYISLTDNISFKFINQRPEIRYRVGRRSLRKKMYKQIKEEKN